MPILAASPSTQAAYSFSKPEAIQRVVEKVSGNTTARAWRFAKSFCVRSKELSLKEALLRYGEKQLLGNPDSSPLRNVIQILGDRGEKDASPFLRKALDHSHPGVRTDALRALAQCADKTTILLLEKGFATFSPSGQALVLKILANRGEVKETVRFFRGILDGKIAPERRSGLHSELLDALKRAKRPQLSLRTLRGKILAFPQNLRAVVAMELHRSGGEEGRVFLLQALQKAKTAAFRAGLVNALAEQVPEASLREIEVLAGDKEALVRGAVTGFFAKIPGKRSTAILEVLASDPDLSVRRGAFRGLRGRSTSVFSDVLGELREATGTKFRILRDLCIEARIPGLVPIIEERIQRTKGTQGLRPLLQALGHLRSKEGIAVLIKVFRSKPKWLSKKNGIDTLSYSALMLANIPESEEALIDLFGQIQGDLLRRSHILGALADLALLSSNAEGLARGRRIHQFFREKVLFYSQSPLRERIQVLGYLKGSLNFRDWARLKKVVQSASDQEQNKFSAWVQDFLWEFF
jgi:HEAT repeat protein